MRVTEVRFSMEVKMSRDVLLKGPDDKTYSYENVRTQSYLEGHEPGVEMVVKWFMARAANLFCRGEYDGARGLRELVLEMKGEVVKECKERVDAHRQGYPEVVDEE